MPVKTGPSKQNDAAKMSCEYAVSSSLGDKEEFVRLDSSKMSLSCKICEFSTKKTKASKRSKN